MTFIRPKPKSPKLGLREPAVLRSDKHLRWIRSCACAVNKCESRQIEAAHVRLGLLKGEQGGVGLKPSDVWCIPLCRDHHADQHRMGEKTFACWTLIASMPALALQYASKSPDPSVRERAEQLRSLV